MNLCSGNQKKSERKSLIVSAMSLKFSTSELKTSLNKAFRDFEKKDSIGAQLANELHVKLFLTSPRGKAPRKEKMITVQRSDLLAKRPRDFWFDILSANKAAYPRPDIKAYQMIDKLLDDSKCNVWLIKRPVELVKKEDNTVTICSNDQVLWEDSFDSNAELDVIILIFELLGKEDGQSSKRKKPSSKKAKEEEPVEEKKAKKASKKANEEEEPVEEKKKTKKPSKKASKEEPADEKPRAKKTSEKPVEEKTKGKKNEKVIEFNEEHQQWMDENGFVFNKDSKTVIGIIKEGVISRLLPEDIEFAKTLRYRVQEGEESQEEEKKEEEPSQAGAQPQEDEDDDGKDIQSQMEEELAAISDLDISREQFELYNSLKDKFSSDSEIASEMKVKPNVVRFIADNYASLLEKFPAATAKKTLKKKAK